LNKHDNYTELIIDESFERLRMHIATVGFDVETKTSRTTDIDWLNNIVKMPQFTQKLANMISE